MNSPFVNPITGPRLSRDSRVVVVGGGTAGWMSAATLRRRVGCAVTLVESSDLPSIGVGEATIPAMVDWLDNMGIDETEFLHETNGTYKLAICFKNWTTPSHRYWHPFGICGATVDGVDLAHVWRRGVHDGWLDPTSQYTDFSLQRGLCEQERSPRRIGDAPEIANYAFHLDAGRLATFLKKVAADLGVRHQVGTISGATLDDSGNLAQLHVEGQAEMTADWFIDCTGFAGSLIEKTMQSPWVDWSDQVLCDRAVTIRAPRKPDEAIPPYTVSTGLSAGWSWEIPLRSEIGAGYVYSSRYVSDDDARAELLEQVGVSDWVGQTRVVPMRVGVRPESWRGNCVAIGLSAGFIEPLESTGIFLIQRALDEWVDACQTVASTPEQRARFNNRMLNATEEIRDFVLLHYVLSRRTDTPFWRDARAVNTPASLKDLRRAYRHSGATPVFSHDPVFFEANHHFIQIGNGCLPPVASEISDALTAHDAPERPRAFSPSYVERYSPLQWRSVLDSISRENRALIDRMPSHKTWLTTVLEDNLIRSFSTIQH